MSIVKNIIGGWIESLDDYPENLSSEALVAYADNGCDYHIHDDDAERIFNKYCRIHKKIKGGEIPDGNEWDYFYNFCSYVLGEDYYSCFLDKKDRFIRSKYVKYLTDDERDEFSRLFYLIEGAPMDEDADTPCGCPWVNWTDEVIEGSCMETMVDNYFKKHLSVWEFFLDEWLSNGWVPEDDRDWDFLCFYKGNKMRIIMGEA